MTLRLPKGHWREKLLKICQKKLFELENYRKCPKPLGPAARPKIIVAYHCQRPLPPGHPGRLPLDSHRRQPATLHPLAVSPRHGLQPRHTTLQLRLNPDLHHLARPDCLPLALMHLWPTTASGHRSPVRLVAMTLVVWPVLFWRCRAPETQNSDFSQNSQFFGFPCKSLIFYFLWKKSIFEKVRFSNNWENLEKQIVRFLTFLGKHDQIGFLKKLYRHQQFYYNTIVTTKYVLS